MLVILSAVELILFNSAVVSLNNAQSLMDSASVTFIQMIGPSLHDLQCQDALNMASQNDSACQHSTPPHQTSWKKFSVFSEWLVIVHRSLIVTVTLALSQLSSALHLHFFFYTVWALIRTTCLIPLKGQICSACT